MHDRPNGRRLAALIIHSLCYGGAERQVVEMARHLDRDNFKVVIITFSDFTPLLASDDPLRDSLVVIKKRARLDFSVFWRLFKVLKEMEVSVAHSFLFDTEIATRLVAKLAGVELVVGSERNSGYRISAWRRIVLKLTLPLTDLIVANSNAGARYHQALYKRPCQKYAVVYNGVDIVRFSRSNRASVRRRLGYQENQFVVGMFASFKPQKNHIVLIEAMHAIVNRYSNIKLILVGDTLLDGFSKSNTYKASILQAIEEREMEDVIEILGNRPDVDQIYNSCDLTVLPSTHEGTPNVVLESMACGVPVIVSDVSDNALLIKNGFDGFVIPLGDTDALATAIERLYIDDNLRHQMGQQARKSVANRMSNESMGMNLGRVYLDHLVERAIR